MERQVQELVAEATPATVALVGRSGAGSGVVVDKEGTILTAAHVIGGASQLTVIFPNGDRAKAEPLGMDFERDIGMARITDEGNWPHVPIGDSDLVGVTDIVITLGHPGGFDIRRPPPVRIGRAYNRAKDSAFIVSDCTLIGGDSGGPLFNLDGELIGIHSSIGERLVQNHHAPVNVARDNWERLEKGERWGGNDDKPVLGVVLDRESRDGVLIEKVYEGSPAEKAGMEVGDRIVRIAKTDVSAYPEFMEILLRRKPGQQVPIRVRRDDEEITLQVKLAKRGDFYKDGKEPPEAKPGSGDAPRSDKEPGYLGLVLETDGGGLRVKEVIEGTGAARADIQPGDVVLSLNGKPVTDPPALARLMAVERAGDTIGLRLRRGEEEITVEVKLGPKP